MRISEWGSAAAIVLEITSAIPRISRAQEIQHLTPHLGETNAEFEARIKGLPRPAGPKGPFSVALLADARGHFVVEPMINGSRVRMLVDTGASIVVLSKQDARRMGINPAPSDFRANASTANGIVLVAPVVLKEISVGELSVYDVQGAVHPDNIQISLLGMSLSCEAIAFRNWWRSARSETVIARYQTLQLPTDLIRY